MGWYGGGGPVGRGIIEQQHLEVAIVLGLHAGQALCQVRAGIVKSRDDDQPVGGSFGQLGRLRKQGLVGSRLPTPGRDGNFCRQVGLPQQRVEGRQTLGRVAGPVGTHANLQLQQVLVHRLVDKQHIGGVGHPVEQPCPLEVAQGILLDGAVVLHHGVQGLQPLGMGRVGG